MKPLPLYSEDLVRELDVTIPEKCPNPDQSDKDIWMYVGMRMVVRTLLRRLTIPNEVSSISHTMTRSEYTR